MSNSSGYSGWDDTGYYQPPPPPPPPVPPHGPGGSRNGLVWALGALALVLVVALAGMVGYLVASRDDAPAEPVADGTSSGQPVPQVTVTETVPSAQPAPPAATVTTRGAPSGDRGDLSGDLGLSVPMSRPACDGRGIVVLYSAVTPGAYAQEISAALAQNPGASYLRTDMACPSLRQRDENGNVIYAVYRPSGYSKAELCADVRATGGAAYGRWLDTTSDPSVLVTC